MSANTHASGGTLPIAAADADGEMTAPAAEPRPGRGLVAMMLLTAAALDLTRCGLVLTAARHPAPAAGLAAAGLGAAALTLQTARGCQAGSRWACWAALLIGAVSAPQAAVSGFRTPYTVPDTATAVLGVLLTVAVLATVGAAGRPGHDTDHRRQAGVQSAGCCVAGERCAAQPRPSRRRAGSYAPLGRRSAHHSAR
jgi:hypothetical protein